MQRVTYFVATTVDGFIARPDDSFDIFVNDGDHATDYLAALRSFDAVVMGRRTYEVGTKLGVDDPYPWLKTTVFSKTLGPSTAPNVTITDDDPVERVRALKEEAGRGIYLCGGGVLAGRLLEHGLVDEVIIKLNPVIAGSGIPMVVTEQTSRLALVDCKVYESDVIVIRYRVVH